MRTVKIPVSVTGTSIHQSNFCCHNNKRNSEIFECKEESWKEKFEAAKREIEQANEARKLKEWDPRFFDPKAKVDFLSIPSLRKSGASEKEIRVITEERLAPHVGEAQRRAKKILKNPDESSQSKKDAQELIDIFALFEKKTENDAVDEDGFA